MILCCRKCGVPIVFSAHPVDWPKEAIGGYCSGCQRVYAIVLEVVKESPLTPAEIDARTNRST